MTAHLVHADNQVASPIYPLLADHQRSESWSGQPLIALLQSWVERFNVEFKLDIPEIVLCLDPLPANRFGQFRYGHNGFGLKGEIAINARYLTDQRAIWEILGTLLHEMLHGWQQVHGTPGKRNHHNIEFRDKARDLGLVIDRRGVTGYAADSPFKALLRNHGIDVPASEVLPIARPTRGRSKLKKWSCGCTNVRVAVADFRAQCLKCNGVFRISEGDQALHQGEG